VLLSDNIESMVRRDSTNYHCHLLYGHFNIFHVHLRRYCRTTLHIYEYLTQLFFQYLDSSIVGLCVSSIINLSNSLSFLLKKFTDLEIRLMSVEKILEYSNLRPEGPVTTNKIQPRIPASLWPAKGEIRFQDVTAEYMTGTPVLSRVSCVFHPHEKVSTESNLINTM